MSKLLKLKEWLDRKEAADLLSYLIQEPVKASDIGEIEHGWLLTPYVASDAFMLGFYIGEDSDTFPPTAEIKQLAEKLEHGASVCLSASTPIPATYCAQMKTSEGTKFGAVVKLADSNRLCIAFPCADKTPLALSAGLEPAITAHIGSLSGDDTYFCKRVYSRAEIFALAKVLNEPGEPNTNIPAHRAGVPEISPYYEGGMAILATGAGWVLQDRISPPLKTDPPSYRLAIHVLLKLLAEPRAVGRNQDGIKGDILARYSGVRGLSVRNLDTIFAEANKAAKDAE